MKVKAIEINYIRKRGEWLIYIVHSFLDNLWTSFLEIKRVEYHIFDEVKKKLECQVIFLGLMCDPQNVHGCTVQILCLHKKSIIKIN